MQLIRYGLVGTATNSVMYLVYLLFTYFSIEPKTAMTFVYFIGLSLGFISNRKWTFAHRGDSEYMVLRYVLAHIVGYFLNLIILFFFVDRLGYPHQWVQAIAIIIVAILLFIIFKYYVFSDKLLCHLKK